MGAATSRKTPPLKDTTAKPPAPKGEAGQPQTPTTSALSNLEPSVKKTENGEPDRLGLILRSETALFARAVSKRTLPVTLLTGFLGSGKTTLLRRIINSVRDFKIGAIVNDFASLNVDYEVVKCDADMLREPAGGQAPEVFELTNGCVCCSLSGDLEDSIWRLLRSTGGPAAQEQEVEYLIVETSGVTDPLEVVRALDRTYGRMARVRLDAIVSVLDADAAHTTLCVGGGGSNATASAAATCSEALHSQLLCADVVLLNKADLMVEDDGSECKLGSRMAELEEKVQQLAPGARVLKCTRCDVPLEAVLDVETVEPEREAFGRVQRFEMRAAQMTYRVRGINESGRGSIHHENKLRRSNGGAPVSAISRHHHNEHHHEHHHNEHHHEHHHHEHHHEHAHGRSGGSGGGSGDTKRDFSSCVIECATPLRLGAFQDVLARRGAWRSVVRAKGTLRFGASAVAVSGDSGSGGVSGRFELSGRCRMQWVSADVDAAAVVAAPIAGVRLVIIATEEEALHKLQQELIAATACCSGGSHVGGETPPPPPPPSLSCSARRAAALEKWLAEDKRFDVHVHAPGSSPSNAASVGTVLFRLTGAKLYGFSEEELALQFGIDLDGVNNDFASSVNNANAALFIVTTHLDNGALGCAIGVGQTLALDEIKAQLARAAELTLRYAFRVVSHCACGR